MSMESAKALVEKMKSDATFAQQVMSIDGNEARIAFVKGQGYDCTLEEAKAIQSELSDDDLDAAAGGVLSPHYNDHPCHLHDHEQRNNSPLIEGGLIIK